MPTPNPCRRLLRCLSGAAISLLAACSTNTPVAPAPAEQASTVASAVEAPPPPAMPEAAMQQAAPPAPNAMPAPAEPMSRALKEIMPAPSVIGGAYSYIPPFQLAYQDRENYGHYDSNPVRRAAENPVSTFSIDVDTGSYANVRRFLKAGSLPPADAVRVEELVNYFDYDYAPPRDSATPFALHTEIAPTPWNPKTELLQIGIQGWKPQGALPPSNLVFLVDVSGSMMSPDKLPLVKASLKLLAHQMNRQDRISLVVYAGNTGVVLEPTAGDDAARIDAALDQLEAGGSTNGGAGIRLAYQVARQAFIKGGNNRVLLATDGDFNVGTTNFEALLDLVREQRKSGVALTTIGVGTGNYNDRLMEQLADCGDGNYIYLDSVQEAQKALLEQRAATLVTIARDVKIQVEFNPALVSEYRLIGYEDRLLQREDFNNDKVDAGDIGAGHRVTALYEVTLAGSGGERIDPLRYTQAAPVPARGEELAFLRVRYKRPQDGADAASRLLEQPILKGSIEAAGDTSPAFRLAAAVAGYGQLLRGGTYTNGFGYAEAARLARAGRGEDAQGYAGEFIQLAQLADSLGAKRAGTDSAVAVKGE